MITTLQWPWEPDHGQEYGKVGVCDIKLEDIRLLLCQGQRSITEWRLTRFAGCCSAWNDCGAERRNGNGIDFQQRYPPPKCIDKRRLELDHNLFLSSVFPIDQIPLLDDDYVRVFVRWPFVHPSLLAYTFLEHLIKPIKSMLLCAKIQSPSTCKVRVWKDSAFGSEREAVSSTSGPGE